jgi:hypothetical protein
MFVWLSIVFDHLLLPYCGKYHRGMKASALLSKRETTF